MKTWLVTGGAGFLGQALVRHLAAAGHHVRVLDLEPRPAAFDPLTPSQLTYLQGDVRDAGRCAEALTGADVVVHAAAALPIHRDAAYIRSVNVGGTRTLLDEAARQPKRPRVVYISSTAVYGLHKEHPITEGNRLRPVGPYGASKVEAEAVCERFRDRLHVAILRPKTFLGEGRLGVFEILFDWIHDGKRIPLIGPGHNRYQLLDVADLVDAIERAAFHIEGSDTFNIAAQRFGTLREDLSPLFAAAGHPARFLPAPRAPTIAALWTLDKLRLSPLSQWHYGTMSQDSYVETGKAQEVLGWQPRRGNQETLLAAFTWYHANRGRVKAGTGTTHTVAWDQRILRVFKRFA